MLAGVGILKEGRTTTPVYQRSGSGETAVGRWSDGAQAVYRRLSDGAQTASRVDGCKLLSSCSKGIRGVALNIDLDDKEIRLVVDCKCGDSATIYGPNVFEIQSWCPFQFSARYGQDGRDRRDSLSRYLTSFFQPLGQSFTLHFRSV